MGFRSLQHIRNSRSTSRGRQPTRYVPSSGFGYPLDGLLPRIPGRFCFTPAALLGFALRRFVPSRGCPGLSAEAKPTCRLVRRLFPRRSGGPAQRTPATGFTPPGSALRSCGGLARQPPAPPMGFASIGLSAPALNPDFAGPPLARFADFGDCSPDPPAPQSIDRPSPRLTRIPHRSAGPAEAALMRFSHLPAPERSSTADAWAIFFTSRRAAHYCRLTAAL